MAHTHCAVYTNPPQVCTFHGSLCTPLPTPPTALCSHNQTASQDFILAACSGNMPQLKALASSGMVHIDVVDKLGYSALFAGALHSQVEVVQFLLNEGADVNRLATDTQYSPLSACCHLLYSPRVGHTKVGRGSHDRLCVT